jgi:RNA polymerase sigma-70 factor, ECF subfamily
MTSQAHQQQFMELLQAHRGIVYKVAGSYSRSPADRDDLAQEICLQLWRAFPGYDPQRIFSAWMYRVALTWRFRQHGARSGPGMPASNP